MNPFQGYALFGERPPFQYAYEPRQSPELPRYSGSSGSYKGIYGTLSPQDPSPGIASVVRGLESPLSSPSGDAEPGNMVDSKGAGFDFGTGYNTPGAFGRAAGALSGVPFGGAVAGALGGIAGAQRANTDLTALGVGPAVDVPGAAFASAMPGFLADLLGITTPQRGFNQAVVSRMSPDDYMSRTASLTGQGTIPGYDLNVQPGQGGPGTPGSDPTPDTSSPDPAPGDRLARGGYVPGRSGGMDDDVPAIIDGKGPARLSSGEFVFDAATVAALGDGNNTAGARKLDMLRKEIRKKAYGHEKQPPKNFSLTALMSKV